MKQIIGSILLATLLFHSPALAAPGPQKPLATIMITQDFSGYFPEDRTKITKELYEKISLALSKHYEVIPGTEYIDNLTKNGVNDQCAAERSDIIKAVDSEQVSTIVFVAIPPVNTTPGLPMFPVGLLSPGYCTITVNIKIIDRAANSYTYTNKFLENGSTPFRTVAKLSPKIQKDLSDVLTKQLPAVSSAANAPAQ
jgi:hypothetical protein